MEDRNSLSICSETSFEQRSMNDSSRLKQSTRPKYFPASSTYSLNSISISSRVSMWSVVKAIGTIRMAFCLVCSMTSGVLGESHFVRFGPTLLCHPRECWCRRPIELSFISMFRTEPSISRLYLSPFSRQYASGRLCAEYKMRISSSFKSWDSLKVLNLDSISFAHNNV